MSQMGTRMRRLPEPDQFGTYWLNPERRPQGAAIFPSYKLKGWFHACDDNQMPLTDGSTLRYFQHAVDALLFLSNRPT